MRILLLTILLFISNIIFGQNGKYHASKYSSSSSKELIVKDTDIEIQISQGLILVILNKKDEKFITFYVKNQDGWLEDDGSGEATFYTVYGENRDKQAKFVISKLEDIYLIKFYENEGFIYYYCDVIK